MPATIARILLAHVKWDKQKLMEKLCDEDNRSSFFEAAHIVDPFEKKTTKRIHWNSKFECAICYTKLPMKVSRIVKKSFSQHFAIYLIFVLFLVDACS